ncbi:uncharacterized protein K452DRAFT_328181 [Aplosporella prunicola CBS 121167]|uniref:ML-like domain-containing protein n=1 Tax=Aplosporella prunicola CBS 121167 TaxID=1176127 RepID=A0A6A6B5E3_9PEZI|nr:uncharacterized protein K452DRAFT_328181 [Aplosporella prunicola CBS 121167]KAF2139260.1 hypothetical protein K452DRAFT_328181 [Aplosporella prunicola CBS 121167]
MLLRSLLGPAPFAFFLAALSVLLPFADAERLIQSKSLNPCLANSSFSATLFNVLFTPDNETLTFDFVGVSDISGNVTLELQLFVYGYRAYRKSLIPCENADLKKGLCPMNTGQIKLKSNIPLDADIIKNIPNIAYNVPDLDGIVQIYINDTNTNQPLACVEAELSNGKTVYQKGVGWATAAIAGLGLAASAITSGLGHSNTAAHVAANALSLFGYFQAQAFIGMTAVELPPIVMSWTQNFQWSMGIIKVTFLQEMATWYQRATGGTPSTVLSDLSTESVQVQKRSLAMAAKLVRRTAAVAARGANALAKRSASDETSTVTVRGIERVGFRANIELTNIFLTGYAFFLIFVLFVILGVCLFKGLLEGLAKGGQLSGNKFQEFRNGWLTVLKGIMFRIVLIGFPQMVVLCFWELTKRDSAAEIVLAIFTIVTMVCILGWASSKVIRIAQRSITMHKNPAYILYSDPVSLNKWGFLYVQFKATAYYFIVPVLGYTLVKGMFIALGQNSGTTQAIALLLLEAASLIAVSILRPYMDKKTNVFNIAIAAINFISAIFLLIFTGVFNQPGLVTGVMGVIFFIYNAVFALVLLFMVLGASYLALTSKNPDTRYQPMRDDRGSFIKSEAQLTTELDALGATARGDGKNGYKPRTGIDDDDDSFSSGSLERAAAQPKGAEAGYYGGPRTPVDSSVPMFPANGADNRTAPPTYSSPRGNTAPYGPGTYTRTNSQRSDGGFRQQNNASPWQRGAGYDH